MKPIGPLMREHRLIERLLEAMRTEMDRMRREEPADPVFIESALDFIRTYADRCHHGKEEDILFRDLGAKRMSAEHMKVVVELIEEHKRGRRVVAELSSAVERYRRGDEGAPGDMLAAMETLVDFYPRHIAKEDKEFFHPCMEYFSREEQDRMLEEFAEFDRKLIHERYTLLVDELARRAR